MIRSVEQFIALRENEDPSIYSRAIHEEASLTTWLEIVESYPEMRRWVAQNKTVPLEVLTVLSDDPDPEVRWAVALKRKLSVELFEKLSRDSDESVRLRLVHNRKTPANVVTALADDSSELVRDAARARRAADEALN